MNTNGDFGSCSRAKHNFKARVCGILADGAAVEAEILEEAAIPRGLIRLASTTAFGVQQLAPLLREFMKKHPEIEIDFEIRRNSLR